MLNFGERTHKGDTTTIQNILDGTERPAITNREFTEVHDYIVSNSTDGASDAVMGHLTALFGVEPRRDLVPNKPTYCNLYIQAGVGYNKARFADDIQAAISFGYTLVEQDSPLHSWEIYYMSLNNNIYCVRFSTTFREINVSSRV